MKPTSTAQHGITLLEMTIVVALSSLVVVVIWSTFADASSETRDGLAIVDVDAKVRRALNRLCEEIVESGQDADDTDHVLSHLKAQTTSVPLVDFERRIDFTGDPLLDWSTPIRFGLADSPGEDPLNLLDDDGDGVVDEQLLVRTQDGDTTILADNVTALLVTRAANSDAITLSVTGACALRATTNQPNVTRTLQTTVALRNRN